MVKKDKECCCVVDMYCKAPPVDGENQEHCRPQCFSCGEHVCVNCSLRRKYYKYGVKRLCHNCIVDRFGVNGEINVLKHQHRLAGYKNTMRRDILRLYPDLKKAKV